MANTNTGEIMLKMTDIHKAYDDLEVLKGIDIEVRRGEVLAIIGPSGSGKSTLLRCINKLETIDKGSIAIKDKFLVQTKDGEAVYASGKEERKILSSTGMVFQQFNLFPHMTVLENLLEAPMQVKVGQGRAVGPGRLLSVTAFRRPAAACGDCQSALHEAGYYAV